MEALKKSIEQGCEAPCVDYSSKNRIFEKDWQNDRKMFSNVPTGDSFQIVKEIYLTYEELVTSSCHEM